MVCGRGRASSNRKSRRSAAAARRRGALSRRPAEVALDGRSAVPLLLSSNASSSSSSSWASALPPRDDFLIEYNGEAVDGCRAYLSHTYDPSDAPYSPDASIFSQYDGIDCGLRGPDSFKVDCFSSAAARTDRLPSRQRGGTVAISTARSETAARTIRTGDVVFVVCTRPTDVGAEHATRARLTPPKSAVASPPRPCPREPGFPPADGAVLH